MTTQDDLEFARSNTLLTARIMHNAGFPTSIGHNGTTLLVIGWPSLEAIKRIIKQEELPIDDSQLTAFPGAVLIDLSEV